MDRPGFAGAAYMCSPSPRTVEEQGRVWEMIRRGTLDVVSSDHCGFSMGKPGAGKQASGTEASFRDIPNGIPGLAARLPILFSEGVSKGRITVEDFVRLTASNPARLMGLPGKGVIAVGADADLALWDPTKKVTLTNGLMQHAIDYTPYEGLEVTGWPVATVRRGAVVMRDGVVQAEPGTGRFLARGPYDFIRPRGELANGFDAAPPPA
jgi:dihydropyrimidinase